MNITVITFPLSAHPSYEELSYFKLNAKTVKNKKMLDFYTENNKICLKYL